MPDLHPNHDQTDTPGADPIPASMDQVSMAAPGRPKDFPVVAIGASAGGLDACRKFLDSLPISSGMAFILIQHLDPTHESMLSLCSPITPR
jgi:two-component system CheB/CheR fusion protein